MAKVRTIVVGFGFMGQTHCGNILSGELGTVEGIVDPCDPLERMATIRGNRAPVPMDPRQIAAIPHFSDLETALTQIKPDAAVIALPTRFHCDGVMAALQHDCHVFVEKPMDVDPENCRKMNHAAALHQKMLAVGHVVRCMSEYEYLGTAIRSGRMGKLFSLKFSRFTGVPTWGNWSDPEFVRASGGSLFDLQCHDLDIALHNLGDVEQIQVIPELCHEFAGSFTAAFLRFQHANVSVEGGFVSPSAYPFHCGYKAFFEKGTLLAEDGKLLEITDAARPVDLAVCDPYKMELELFLHSVASGKERLACNGIEAEKVIGLCCRIRELVWQKTAKKA